MRNWVKGFNHFHIFSVFFLFVEIEQGEFMSSSLCASFFARMVKYIPRYLDRNVSQFIKLTIILRAVCPLVAICYEKVDFCMSAKCFAHMIYRHTRLAIAIESGRKV